MQRTTTTALVAAFLLTHAPMSMAEEPLTQGIEVHGHWKIEILDPDGTSVSVQEFENALVAGGESFLAGLLGRQSTQGLWKINLFSSTSDPCQYLGAGAPCQIAEPADPAPADSSTSKNLTVNGSGNQFVLSGSVTATGQGANPTIDWVSTQTVSCLPSTSPDSCLTGPISPFSATSISPVAVQTGQIIQVTVTFTFS